MSVGQPGYLKPASSFKHSCNCIHFVLYKCARTTSVIHSLHTFAEWINPSHLATCGFFAYYAYDFLCLLCPQNIHGFLGLPCLIFLFLGVKIGDVLGLHIRKGVLGVCLQILGFLGLQICGFWAGVGWRAPWGGLWGGRQEEQLDQHRPLLPSSHHPNSFPQSLSSRWGGGKFCVPLLDSFCLDIGFSDSAQGF